MGAFCSTLQRLLQKPHVRHSRAGGNPFSISGQDWIPAFAGMTRTGRSRVCATASANRTGESAAFRAEGGCSEVSSRTPSSAASLSQWRRCHGSAPSPMALPSKRARRIQRRRRSGSAHEDLHRRLSPGNRLLISSRSCWSRAAPRASSTCASAIPRSSQASPRPARAAATSPSSCAASARWTTPTCPSSPPRRHCSTTTARAARTGRNTPAHTSHCSTSAR